MRTARRAQGGFTLVEIVVGLAVLSLLTLVMAGTFLVGARTVSQEAREISADNAIGDASLALTRDLSSATTISAGTINPGAGNLQYRYGTPVVTVVYTIDVNRNLLRQVVGGNTTVAARGVLRLTVAPPGAPPCYLTVTVLPSAVGAVASTLNISRRILGCF